MFIVVGRAATSLFGQFETVERKAGCHGAAGERPMTETFRCLPSAGWHHRLWDFACMDISAETEDFFFRAIDQFKFERRARVIVPNLNCVDAMPMRTLATGQQKQIAVEAGRPLTSWVAKVSR